MKKLILTLTAISLVACNNGETDTTSQLGKLKSEKDSLEILRKDVGLRLAELKEEIALLDTSIEYANVTILEMDTMNFDHYLSVYGNIEAENNVTLYPEFMGVIKNIRVKEGDQVKQGQILIELDAETVVKQIEEVETQLKLATTLFEKQERLWVKERVGSEVQYLQAKNNKERLESTLKTLQSQLAKSKVRAPFSGVVDRIFPKKGELAAQQSPMARIVNMSRVYVEADVPEDFRTSVVEGTKVKAKVPSIDWSAEATVTQVGDFINPNNRTFRIRVELKNTEGKLVPNQLVSLSINDYTSIGTYVIPSNLVQQNTEGQNFVYLFERKTDHFGIVRKQKVVAGINYEGQTEILEGIDVNSVVINQGSRSVKDGQKVSVIEIE